MLQTNFKLISALAILGSLAGCGGSSGDDNAAAPALPVVAMPLIVVENAVLSPTQEVAEVASIAKGIGSLSMNAETGEITGSLTTSDMTGIAAHIHTGAGGVNGPIIVSLVADAVTAGKWNVPTNTILTKEQQDSFTAGALYFNVHSAAFPTGEVRGQIGREVALARLSGVQEVEQNASAGSALGAISFDPDTSTADLTLTFADITPTAAHIHAGAIGVNGPIIVGLGTPVQNKYSVSKVALTEAQVADFRAKKMYFNMHTAQFPAGEIRGQIGYQVRIATMDGAQENPPVATASTGLGFVAYDPEAKTAFGQLTVSMFTPIAAHIHRGIVGVNGPIIVGLKQNTANPQGWATDGLVPWTDADALLLMTKGLYLNAHSTAFPTGEVRGQLNPNK